MPYCEKCGAEVGEKDKYCTKCGASITRFGPVRVSWRPPRDECFGEREEERDIFGWIAFGMFLLIVAIMIYVYPWIFSDVQILFQGLGEGAFQPSTRLVNAFAVFIGLLAVSNFIEAGLRALSGQQLRRLLRNVLGGTFLVIFAYFVYLYGQKLLTWQIVGLLFFVTLALIVILYGIISERTRKPKAT